LASADANANIDFTSGTLNNANLINMGIGAVSTGVTFTGSITPANNTYKLGGGGTLTLPNATLTGASNNLKLDNGGTTVLNGANTYGGVTTVGGNYTNPFQAVTAIGQSNSLLTNPGTVRTNSTLQVNTLADGGVASSIGSGSNAASSLVLNGGTLKYVGAGSNTDRLFTLSPLGATLDSSGTGAVNFTNTGAIVTADAATRSGTVDSATANAKFVAVADVSDLTVGMTVSGTSVPAGTTIVSIHPAVTSGNFTGGPGTASYYIQVSAALPVGTTIPDLAFGNQNRALSLTGTNTAANTISGALSDSTGGKLAITKTGAGTWALAGTNSYTGATTVSGGTLAVNSPAAISAGSTVTVGGGTSAAVYKIGWDGTTTSASLALPTLAANGKFDIAKGRVVLTGTTEAAVAALVGDGAAGTGTIYTSSFGSGKAVGFGDVGAGGVTVRYTYQGDADLNGTVNFNDFLVLQNNFNNSGVFSKGDFDYNGTVNFNDFLVLQNNFGNSITGAAVSFTAAQVAAIQSFAATVPEPTSLALLGLGAAAALRRRTAC
jgi:fibronectin-binding autotransporter adhesin